MEKQNVIEFFDKSALTWDEKAVRNEPRINRILDNARIGQGQYVLDIACGTGILFPFYLDRQVARITGIDISPQMVRQASEKYAGEPKIQVCCGDAEIMEYDRKYDRIMIYNALPHFPDPAGLIRKLSFQLENEGKLTIAHSMSHDRVNMHHQNVPDIACPLPETEELVKFFSPWFNVDVIISDEEIFEVSGTVKETGSK